MTADERLRAIAVASPRLRAEPVSTLEKEWTIRQEFLTIDLAPFLKGVHQKLAELGEARALVVEDPDSFVNQVLAAGGSRKSAVADEHGWRG